MTLRIVHLADLHLDMAFANSGRGSQIPSARREGLRQALKATIQLTKQWNADVLTVGGDLYESERVSRDTEEFLRQQFEAAAPLRVLISPGNHDPYTRSSPYGRVDWPANVFIFREPRLTPVELKDGMTLWGAGHDNPAFFTPLLRQFRLPGSAPAILLLHGTDSSLTLGEGKHAFCPFSEEEVRAAGFTLALLGHIHRQRLPSSSRSLLCYPGSPEPLGFDEEEGHSVLLAEWTGNNWRLEGRDISRWMCRSAEIDVSDFTSRDQAVERMRLLWKEERQDKRCLARIDLVGQPPSSLALDIGAMQAALASDFAEVYLADRTDPPFDLESLQREVTVTGAFVRRMLREAEEAEKTGDEPRKQLVMQALRYGLTALEGWEIRSP